MPGVLSSRSSHTPCGASLFSWYLSRLVCSCCSLLTHLAWACCSRGIRHAWCGLVAVFSHALRGFVVLIGGGGRSAGSRVERGSSVERDNQLRGEESPDELPRPSFILFRPSVESQVAGKTDRVPLSNILTRSPRPRRTHDRTRPLRGQHSIRGNRIKDAQAVTVKEKKTDEQLNQGKTILVTNMGEGRARSINGRQQMQWTGEGHTSNIEETKERGLDQPAVGDIATGAIWRRSV